MCKLCVYVSKICESESNVFSLVAKCVKEREGVVVFSKCVCERVRKE